MSDGETRREYSARELQELVAQMRRWAAELGLGALAVSDVDLAHAEQRLVDWLERGFHGEMDYMSRHGRTRARPGEVAPGSVRAIVVRCDYLDESGEQWQESGWRTLAEPLAANVSRYARGRDYHKVLRARLHDLAARMAAAIGPYGYRVLVDSAPLMEVELATKAGLGWRGKHTLLLSREAGSMFFLGEILVDVPLPVDAPAQSHCGTCQRCIDICPTQAIIAPYLLDARRCISYLTIEFKGSIPDALRRPIGNRIYGCDDCQLVCPWNKYAQRSELADFADRGYAELDLIEAFSWDEEYFLRRTEGSALRRISHVQWLRNVAIALGNALAGNPGAALRLDILGALALRLAHSSELVREHVTWAMAQGDLRTSAPDTATSAE